LSRANWKELGELQGQESGVGSPAEFLQERSSLPRQTFTPNASIAYHRVYRQFLSGNSSLADIFTSTKRTSRGHPMESPTRSKQPNPGTGIGSDARWRLIPVESRTGIGNGCRQRGEWQKLHQVREPPVLAFEAFWGEGDRVLVSGCSEPVL